MQFSSDKDKRPKVHFMGVGGSALSGVSVMARKKGFDVSGCDLDDNTPYLEKVKKAGIKVYRGHDERHLEDVDVLAVSPAVIYQNEKHPEYTTAKKLGKLQTWDEFVGKYLLQGKEVVCITGTHGKSTVTSMASLMFENAGLDPSCLVGATVKEWGNNFRVGNGKHLIIEADDFYEKFLNYKPSTIVLNNIEYDHPDFFKSEEDMVVSYAKFVKLLRGPKNLIINQDSQGNKELFDKLGKSFIKSINVFGYSLSGRPAFDLENSFRAKVAREIKDTTEFRVTGKAFSVDEQYSLSLPGVFNVENSMGTIVLGKVYGVDYSVINKTLSDFKGIGRRLELIGERKGISVYDDYAHHPTAIRAALGALSQKCPKSKIWAVVEPHSYSRTKALLNEYAGVFDGADEVIIAPIYKARDRKTFGISEELIIKASGKKEAKYVGDFNKIAKLISKKAKNDDVVLVMGAGKSYQLARQILDLL